MGSGLGYISKVGHERFCALAKRELACLRFLRFLRLFSDSRTARMYQRVSSCSRVLRLLATTGNNKAGLKNTRENGRDSQNFGFGAGSRK
jgi:hypothetical protein